MRVHWHRRDLRVADNRALTAGSDGQNDSEQIVPIFVFDQAILDHGASPRVAFMLDALASLREAYRERGSDLYLASGDPASILPAVCDLVDADAVTWGRDYSGLARERDADVRQALADADVERRAVHDSVHHEPGTITTNDGDPYKVFTYFSKKWHDREKRSPLDPPTEAQLAADVPQGDVFLSELPTLADLGFDDPEASIPPAGSEHARGRLDQFCADDIYEYAEQRDYPASENTSRLSADLKFGTLGIRDVYERTEQARERAKTEEARESVTEFQDQLAWREFYAQVLWDRPDVVQANYKSYENPIEWREDAERLTAWKAGETGYPIVDAGMRQLRAKAFMHNRVRMIVASFLTKDLLIDWREGYQWFCERLVDHDTANDNGGWQWAASTGTDAQPYFRIFNPMKQGADYDPDAEYIKRYVPELSGVDAETVHAWHTLSPTERAEAAPAYPAPIVDHSEQRERAIEMFERARGE